MPSVFSVRRYKTGTTQITSDTVMFDVSLSATATSPFAQHSQTPRPGVSQVVDWRSAGRRAPATSLSTSLAAAAMPKLAVTIITAPKPPAVPGRDRPKVAFWATFRHWPFLRLTLMFSLLALGHWMIIAFLRPVLAGIGVPDGMAVMAAAAVGPAQVAGRLALMAAGVRLGGRAALLATLAGFVVAPGVLVLAGVAMPLVFAFALLQGAANGVLTILRPLLLAEDLGSEDFGTLSGMMAIAILAASAVAPMLGAALMAAGGWSLLVAVAGFAALLALVVLYTVINPPTTMTILSERHRLGRVDRQWTPIEDINPVVARTIVAAEDANFCQHWGFDMRAIRSALDDGANRGA